MWTILEFCIFRSLKPLGIWLAWPITLNCFPPLSSLDAASIGFIIIIDRRKDKWSSVKASLSRIAVSSVRYLNHHRNIYKDLFKMFLLSLSVSYTGVTTLWKPHFLLGPYRHIVPEQWMDHKHIHCRIPHLTINFNAMACSTHLYHSKSASRTNLFTPSYFKHHFYYQAQWAWTKMGRSFITCFCNKLIMTCNSFIPEEYILACYKQLTDNHKNEKMQYLILSSFVIFSRGHSQEIFSWCWCWGHPGSSRSI